MLTLTEKLLFLFLTVASLSYTLITFGAVYRVIRRGKDEFPSLATLAKRADDALVAWLSERPIWRTRRLTSIFHAMIAWGFTFYFLVNLGDLLQGFFPITFLGRGIVGDLYRLLADLFTTTVLVGMVYFLLRRFVFRSPALHYRENVKLV